MIQFVPPTKLNKYFCYLVIMLLALPSSNDHSCLTLFMVSPNDFVCCASELGFSWILVLQKCYDYLVIT